LWWVFLLVREADRSLLFFAALSAVGPADEAPDLLLARLLRLMVVIAPGEESGLLALDDVDFFARLWWENVLMLSCGDPNTGSGSVSTFSSLETTEGIVLDRLRGVLAPAVRVGALLSLASCQGLGVKPPKLKLDCWIEAGATKSLLYEPAAPCWVSWLAKPKSKGRLLLAELSELLLYSEVLLEDEFHPKLGWKPYGGTGLVG
jgi:hypothetical protein